MGNFKFAVDDLQQWNCRKAERSSLFYKIFALFLPPNLVRITSVIHLARRRLEVCGLRRLGAINRLRFEKCLVQIAGEPVASILGRAIPTRHSRRGQIGENLMLDNGIRRFSLALLAANSATTPLGAHRYDSWHTISNTQLIRSCDLYYTIATIRVDFHDITNF